MIELLTATAAFLAAVAAVWNRLRVGRYRDRWREAVKLHEDTPDATDGKWEVRLRCPDRHIAEWIVTDGHTIALITNARLEYQSLSKMARETADNLARDLNDGKIKVA